MAHLCKGGCHKVLVTGGLIYYSENIIRSYIQPMFSIPTGSTFVDPPPLKHKGEAFTNVTVTKNHRRSREASFE